MATKGLWNIGGFNLPDFGISEALGIGPRNAGVSSSSNSLNYNQGLSPYATPQPTQSFSNNYVSTNPSLNQFSGAATKPVLGASTQNTGMLSQSSQQSQQQTQQQTNPFQGQATAEYNQAQAELDAALNEFDRNEELLTSQVSQNESEKNRLITEGQTEYGKAQKSGAGLITEAGDTTKSEEQKSLSTAQDTQKSNRNMLRALGILSSSAAGEMLGKPMEAHAQNVAELGKMFIKRKQQVEDWLTQKGDELSTYKQTLESQYQTVVQNIQRDVRFNRQRKMEALKAAQTAFSQRVSELNLTSQNYQTAAKQYNDNLALQLAQITQYNNPQANLSGITKNLMQPAQQVQPLQVGVLGQGNDEEYKKKMGLLSAEA